MTDEPDLLPSWRPGATRDAVIEFLDAATLLPVGDRVAVFDNDGTLCCEQPAPVQFEFFVRTLADAAQTDPTLRGRPEFAAVLDGDHAAMAELGLERIALAVLELFAGLTPAEFDHAARSFFAEGRHRTLGTPLRDLVYQPMLELLDELRRREFTLCIVSGSGTEFVRAISQDFYGVAPEAVVGTLIAYEFDRDARGQALLRRTATLGSAANEGPAKVNHIQSHLGRQPILGAGNSAGDREMLEWACAGAGPRLALLLDHDDSAREFQYVSTAATFVDDEPILDIGARLGWTVVSMANDWATVFPNRT